MGGGINVDVHYKGFMYLFLKYEIIWNIAVTLSCRRVENTSTLQTAANRRSQSVTWNIGLDELCLFPVTVSHGDGQCYRRWRSSNIWHEVISVHSTIHECLSTCDVCVRLPKLKVCDSTASPPQRHGGFLSGLCNNNNKHFIGVSLIHVQTKINFNCTVISFFSSLFVQNKGLQSY